MRFWSVRCPYCNGDLASGTGYGDKVPEIWVPFVRCKFCGKLVKTGSKEYLSIPIEERLMILKRTEKNSKDHKFIKDSLGRTNLKEYRDFLTKEGVMLYPLENSEKEGFPEMLLNNQIVTPWLVEQELYDSWILLRKELIDEKSGEIKKEVLQENRKEYKRAKRFTLIAIISILTLFIVFIAIGLPPIVCLLLGFGGGLGIPYLISSLIDKKKNKKR